MFLFLALAGNSACSLLEWSGKPGSCDICRREIRPATHYRVHLKDGHVEEVCCPRCGLRFEDGRRDVVKREVADFETGDLFNAEDAFYVENSSVHFCCAMDAVRDRAGSRYSRTWDRCLPSLLAFRSQEAAARFQHKKGGVVRTLGELTLEGSP